MVCPNCTFVQYCLGFCTFRVEPSNWAIAYNGHIVEKEFASERDANDTISVWEAEMANQHNKGEYGT